MMPWLGTTPSKGSTKLGASLPKTETDLASEKSRFFKKSYNVQSPKEEDGIS
jgi:hypothetical protein